MIDGVTELDLEAIHPLVEESISQGFRFLERLVREYQSGFNRFDQLGEVLLTASIQATIIGIGGLNRDPYSSTPAAGRVRHLYVQADWRRRGVGRSLMTCLICHARPHYQQLTLRTDSPTADRFYQTLGFQPCLHSQQSTHILHLCESSSEP